MDFNIRIGSNSHETSPSVIGIYMYHGQKNTNQEYLVDFCEEKKSNISLLSPTPQEKPYVDMGVSKYEKEGTNRSHTDV